MKCMRTLFTGLLALVMLASSALAQNKVPDVLAQVDETCDLVIVVPNIGEANKAAAQFIKDLQLPMPLPPMEKPLDMLFAQLGITDGLDENGSAAFVIPNVMQLQQMGDPNMYFVLPIADEAKALATYKKNAEAVEDYEGVFVADVPGSGDMHYKVVGKYLVVGSSAEATGKQKAAADKTKLMTLAGDLGRANMADGQIFAFFNMAKVGPQLAPMARMGLLQVEQEIDQNPDDPDLQIIGGPAGAKSIVQMAGSMVNSILTETDAVVASANLSKAGAKLNLAAQFKPDTQLGEMFAQTSNSQLSLDRLPNENFMMAGAFDLQRIPIEPLMKSIREEILPKIPADSPVGDIVRGYVDSVEATKHVKGAQFAAYLPSKQGDPPMQVASVYELDDAQAYMTKQRKAMTQVTKGLKSVLNQAMAQTNGPSLDLSYNTEVEQIDGVTVDVFKMKMNMPEEAGMRAMAPMGVMAGMFDQTTYMGIKDNLMLGAQGGGEDGGKALFSKLLKTSDGSGKLTTNAAIAAARKSLPGHRFAEGYFNVGGYVQMIMDTMQQAMAEMGGQGPAFPAVPDMPPMAFSGSQKSGALGLTVVVPQETIKQGATFVFGMQAMAMGGMQQQGPAMEEWEPMDTAEVEGDDLQPDTSADNTQAPTHAAAGDAKVTALGDATFTDAIGQGDQPTVVLYWASWSTNAKKQAKTHAAVSAQFDGKARFATVDVDNADVTVESQAIETVPITKVYLGGKELESKVGVLTKAQLAELVKKHTK